MADKRPLVVVMAGGTGGHIFPGIAVARCLRAQGVEVLWLGASGNLECEIVPKEKFDLVTINIKSLRGKRVFAWLLAPWQLSIAFWQILILFVKRRPSLVLGLGGFVTGPGGVVAFVLGIPLLIHEQNAVAGWTNKCLAPLSQSILCGFPNLAIKGKSIWVGNPVRHEFAQVGSPTLPLTQDKIHLLVVGGSRGASIFNQLVPQALRLMAKEERPKVKHQTGRGRLNEVLNQLEVPHTDYQAFEFEDQIDNLYRWADLILCRAGAMTIAEVAAAGRATILVPYPYATDNHQLENAHYLVEKDAALLLTQDQFTASSLAESLLAFVRDRAYLVRMSQAAKALAVLDADRQIADICMQEMAA